MKKAILGLAFLTIASVSFSVSAQKTNTECQQTECKKECKDKKACDKKDCKSQKACCKNGQPKTCPFDGLNLTDTQKSQIEALNKAAKVSKQETASKLKDSNNEAKANLKKQNKTLREEYLKDLSKILTPEQYSQFLKNYYVNNPGHNKAKGGKMGSKGPKGQKGQMGGPKGHKGPKGERGPKATK